MSKPILVSSCLIGKKCSYDGEARTSDEVVKLCDRYSATDVCPEIESGLGSPRERHEIKGGSGEDVLSRKARVISSKNEDRTEDFLRGAEATLKKAQENGVSIAIMKSKSPSCGKYKVYNGEFNGTLCDGPGVATALLMRSRIKVFTEKEIEKVKKELA